MLEPKKCRVCGADIQSNAPFGHCPKCLLKMGFGPMPKEQRKEPHVASVRDPMGTVRYFGDYELLEQIGRGGMGVVYKAQQLSLHRSVALKRISAGELASPTAVQRFHLEAEAAAKLDHPNIVPIYEIGVHQGQHYFSMKLISGGSLEELARRTSIPARDAALLLVRIARAIHYAHQHGVIHRDLKPGNILLDAAGEPHVTDFGLAKILEHEMGVTRTAEVLGTPSYMSPEQVAGRLPTTATDVWSLGVILYELLTGRPPFRAENTPALLRKIAEEEPGRISNFDSRSTPQRDPTAQPDSAIADRSSRIDNSIGRDLETICLKCLEKDPERRYSSAAALADDLEHWLSDEPILARRATLFERAVLWSRRQPALAAAVILLHFVLLLGIGGVAWQWRRAAEANYQTGLSNDHYRRALDQMDSIQLQRAEEYFAENRRTDALPRWALVLRSNPSNRLAAERLMSTLSHRNWAHLACPPLEHSNRVTFALLSRDGTKVVTSSADNTACVWDAMTGRRLAGPFTHEAEINMAILSEDGQLVVTASTDKTARIWSVRTGRTVAPPLQHSRDVSMAGFSSDGKHVFTVSGEIGQLWNISTGLPTGDAIKCTGRITDVRLSPDGSRLAVACTGRRAQIWDAASGICLHYLKHTNDITTVAFSPNGKQLVTASYDNTARVWDVQTGLPAGEPLQHQARLWTAEFSPDGLRIVTASGDGTAQVWDARTGRTIGRAMKHEGEVRCALFSPEGTRVVTASWDKTVRVWDATSGEPLTEPLVHDDRMFFAGFFPDGTRILTAGNGKSVLIWNVAPLGGGVLTGHEVSPSPTEFSPDGKLIAVRRHSGNSELLEPYTLAKKGELVPSESAAYRFAFSPDGAHVATASLDKTARVWNARTGNPVTPPLVHSGRVIRARFSRDGKKLVTASEDKAVHVWSAHTGRPVIPPIRCDAQPRWMDFGPDNHRLVVAAGAPEAGVWDVQTGRKVFSLRHRDTVHWAEFSRDGTQIVTASADMTAQLWNAKTGERIGPGFVHPLVVTRAHLSPDGERLITTTKRESGAWLWDTRTGQKLKEPSRSEDSTSVIAFSPDGKRFATASQGRNAWLWDAWTGQRLSENLARPDAPLRSDNALAKFSPDGRLVAIATDDKSLRILEAPAAPLPVRSWLPELAEGLAGQRFNQQGQLESVRPAELWAVQQRMNAWVAAQGPERDSLARRQNESTEHGSPASNVIAHPSPTTAKADGTANNAFYARWAKWFLADASTRTVLPSSPLTLHEYAVRLSERRTFESASEALRLWPTNGYIMALLAGACFGRTEQTNGYAEWLTQHATETAPDLAVTWWSRAIWLLGQKRPAEAVETMARVEPLTPNNPKFYNDHGAMMAEAGQWTNAIAAFTKSLKLTCIPTSGLRQLRRDAFHARRLALDHLGRNGEAYHDLVSGGWIPPRATNTSNALIDLSRFYNESYFERLIERGLPEPFLSQRTVAGSDFDLRGIVQLAGPSESTEDGNFPEKVVGIPIHQSVRMLHFLQATKGRMPDGARVGHYAIHFANGEEHIVPIVYGEHLRDFMVISDPIRRLKAATEAWSRPDLDPDQNMRMAKHTWPNPRPNVAITTIDFVSAKTRCAPFLVALTVEPLNAPDVGR